LHVVLWVFRGEIALFTILPWFPAVSSNPEVSPQFSLRSIQREPMCQDDNPRISITWRLLTEPRRLIVTIREKWLSNGRFERPCHRAVTRMPVAVSGRGHRSLSERMRSTSLTSSRRCSTCLQAI
jgi:hypothetical protein